MSRNRHSRHAGPGLRHNGAGERRGIHFLRQIKSDKRYLGP